MRDFGAILETIKQKYVNRQMRNDSRKEKRLTAKFDPKTKKWSSSKPEFDETKHPRDENGQFTTVESGDSKKPEENKETKQESNAPEAVENKVTEKKPLTKGEKALRAEVDKLLKEGKIKTKIIKDLQNRHRETSDYYKNELKKGHFKSVIWLSDDELEKIVDKYVKTGKIFKKGSSYRVYFEHDKEIGRCYKPDGSAHTDVSSGLIHLSKDGVHIVPVLKKD